MELRTLLAPLALLTDGELGASAKIVSLVHRLDKKNPPPRPLAPTRLTERTGLARKTVAAALAELARSRWSPVRDMSEALDRGRKRSGETLMVKMPAALLTDRAIGAQARVLYGVLQGIPGFDYPSGECTYADLAAFAQLDARTVRRGMRQLVESGWAEITQANRRALVHYTLRDPIASGSEREVAEIRRRVEKARFLGETLMRASLADCGFRPIRRRRCSEFLGQPTHQGATAA